MPDKTLQPPPRKTLKANINYADPSADLVYDQRHTGPGPASLIEQVIPQQVTLHDGRQLSAAGEAFSLTEQGFELVEPNLEIDLHQLDETLRALDSVSNHALAPQARDTLIRTQWYPALQKWLATHLGAEHVLTFDHTLRAQASADSNTEKSRSRRAPVKIVHNDYTPWSAQRQLHQTLPEYNLNPRDFPRYQFVNLWLPLLNPVEESPLAMVDLRSVVETDFHKMRLIYPEREGQISVISPNPKHRWIWFSAMRPGEGLLLRVFDSEHTGTITGTPHSAFDLPDSENAVRRTSIEVRTIALYK
ncbi:CmcJ/NvfI family oxidoreductase [uncultured Microbulbifer sp.]|uniref:CmcJ/NvfI family oxidoreductase n=1 Tax=uncultured Microbulbifer sp. TaxID=348147 RepID=UPI00262B234A|nr:CmcJ/NvfI family oxidoreductase [uncultured Microbulbifer sp.]